MFFHFFYLLELIFLHAVTDSNISCFHWVPLLSLPLSRSRLPSCVQDADTIEKLNESGDLRQILRRYKVSHCDT